MSFGDSSEETSSDQASASKTPVNQDKINHERSTPADSDSQTHTHNEPEILNAGVKVFRCDEKGCDKAYGRRWRLTVHKQNQHGYKHESLLQEPTVKKPKKDLKKHKCPEPGCEAVFTRPYRLENHIMSWHRGDNPFKCAFENCSKSFSSHSHLKRHIIRVHDEEKDDSKVECGVENCGLLFANKYSLKKHIVGAHTELRFECQICHQKFHRKSILHAHKVEVHKEVAPYTCDECPKAFVQLNQYRKHKSCHRNYICDCEKSFGRWTEYLKHKRTECTIPKAQYKCAICDKTFNLKQNLTQHCIKVHLHESQVNDFKCPYLDCQRSYKYQKNLNCHMKTYHEKIFQYMQCPKENCETVLKSKKNLKQHLRHCHSDKPKKEKFRKKPRKDKGLPKKSTASELSGFRVSAAENKRNLTESDKKSACSQSTVSTVSSMSDWSESSDDGLSNNSNEVIAVFDDQIMVFDFQELELGNINNGTIENDKSGNACSLSHAPVIHNEANRSESSVDNRTNEKTCF